MKKSKEQIVKTTIRVPKSVWDAVRIQAIKQNISAEKFVVEALTRHLKGGN